jgi:hypothetical protein
MTVDGLGFSRCKVSVDADSFPRLKYLPNSLSTHEQCHVDSSTDKSRELDSDPYRDCGRGRNIGRFFIWWCDRQARQREEARKKPVLDIEIPQDKSQFFVLKCGEDRKPIAGRLIFTRVRPTTQAAAFGLKAGGTIVPPFELSDVMAFVWTPRGGLGTELEVDRKTFSAEVRIWTIAEIGRMMKQPQRLECDIASGIGTPLILGLTLEGSSHMFFGDELVKLPCESKVGILVFNNTYGTLIHKWFKASISAWDKIAFEPTSSPD